MEHQKRKIKILMLGTRDIHLAGHVMDNYNRVPEDLFEKKMIVLESCKKKEPYAFFYRESFWYKIRKKMFLKFHSFFRWVKFGTIVDKNKSEFCFYSFDDECKNANNILAKCKDFIPDVISVHWVAGFVSSKTIRDLYELTRAHFVLFFVDEAPLSGGCHYHCDCEQYLFECQNCPVLKRGKKIAHIQMQNKIANLSDIPMTIIGSPYDMEKAKETIVYKNADIINSVPCPNVIEFPRDVARKDFNINEKDFVIFVGASNLHDKRKGLEYSLDALKLFSKGKENVAILICGKEYLDASLFGNVRVIQPGFLDKKGMCKAFCACDVFLSSTIADSGPMMVNYSFMLGVPVVSFDLGIARTLIKHKKTGFLAKYKDSRSLKEGIDFIYGMNKTERESMREHIVNSIKKYIDTPKWYDLIYQKIGD
ncbi:MAG: glycosyltransferase [Bacteroidaceae bacterium]|nr:glycosyltransferase [Bacteroidaceae bacterium]